MFCDLNNGRWRFIGGGRPKGATLPATVSPAPTPTSIDVEAQRKAEDVRRKLKARAGREGTILTEGNLGVPDLSFSTLLGGDA